MKRLTSCILALMTMASGFVSCDKQDDTYRQYVVNGGYNYPAKPIDVTFCSGYNRVGLKWAEPLDPAVRRVKVYWDNYADSVVLDYNTTVDGYVNVVIDKLEERSYSFDIVNFDKDGNRSLATEVTVAPYGDGWLATHAERRLSWAQMDGDKAVITMGTPMDEMIATKFRYRNTSGQWIESEEILPAGEFQIALPDALKGKLLEYKSAYCPKAGIDTVWNQNWTKSNKPIVYNINGSKASVTVTDNQVYSGFTPDKVVDGIKDKMESRWFSSFNSSYRNKWPKILCIDTKLNGDSRMTFTNFKFYENPAPDAETQRYIKAVDVYVGDKLYNVNASSSQLSTFGTPVAQTTLNTTGYEFEKFVDEETAGRYIGIVFKNSFSSVGYIDLWEFEAYGYVASEVD